MRGYDAPLRSRIVRFRGGLSVAIPGPWRMQIYVRMEVERHASHDRWSRAGAVGGRGGGGDGAPAGRAAARRRGPGVHALPPPKAGDLVFKASWKDGLCLETVDGAFRMNVGGRFFIDAAWISEDRDVKAVVGDQEDGVEFRTARIHVQGEL